MAHTNSKPNEKTPASTMELTWEDPGVRADVIKNVNLRPPKAHRLKLNFIAKNTPDSAQKFIRKVLLPTIDQ